MLGLLWLSNDARRWTPDKTLTLTKYCSQLKYSDVFAILPCLTAPHPEGQASVVTVSF